MDKLKALRVEMKRLKLNGYLVPRQDEFQGEYVCAYAERLKWLTGFAGSWGTAIVLEREATIFVDGRYTTQVRQQVNTKLFTPKHLMDEPPSQWLQAKLKKGQRLGFDPMLTTTADARRLRSTCEAANARLVPVRNLIDAIWKDQPPRPQAPLTVQPVKYAGRSAKDKLKAISAELKKAKADAVVITEPSSTAWAFNLRGQDVPFTPVVLAYAILHQTGKPELFIDPSRVPREAKPLITVRPPRDLEASLTRLKGKTVWLDEGSAPDHVRAVLIPARAKIIAAADPCTMPKAQKNTVEQQGARDAQLRDGVALSNFLHWLSVEAPKGKLTEGIAAEKLHEFRMATGKLLDLSFETIPAAAGNAAMSHYHLANKHGRAIKLNEIFLIDSGGQYRDGTTDVTRTVIIGNPTEEMRDRFTRVLKGLIALSLLRFPEGTTGAHIDALARQALWAGGFDFDHGTGHGIGSYLSVHEGPARISKAGHVALKPGMILSNEPGYYKPGHYGIRTENLLIVRKPAAVKGGERNMMGFETLTLAPIDRNLIDSKLLTRDELRWLDAYHARVIKEVGSKMKGTALSWLKKVCAPLD